MRLLCTGGAGFIGSHFIKYVLEKPEVRMVVNLDCLTYAGNEETLRTIDERNTKYFLERVDLRNKSEVHAVMAAHKITHVVHLAAESHVDRSITGPSAFIDTNIVGTFNLLEACTVAWGKTTGNRFLHVSTDEVFGDLGPSGAFTEASPYRPSSPYAASKAASDMLVRAYNRTYGLPTIITNCCNNYGPFQYPEKLIPVVIQSLIERKKIPVYGDGKNIREWIHVSDHVEALWKVLINGANGNSYVIGSRNEYSNMEMVICICNLFDAYFERGVTTGFSQDLIEMVPDRPGHDERYAVDPVKLRQLGWLPTTKLIDGLHKTIEWYRNNQDWVRAVTRKRS